MLGLTLVQGSWSNTQLCADFNKLWICHYRSVLHCVEYSLFSTRHQRKEKAISGTQSKLGLCHQ